MITSKDNEMIKHVSKLLSSSSYRRQNESFIAEGARLCIDGVLSGAEIKAFLYTKNGIATDFIKCPVLHLNPNVCESPISLPL